MTEPDSTAPAKTPPPNGTPASMPMSTRAVPRSVRTNRPNTDSSSNNNESSAKMQEITPMELAPPTSLDEEKISPFKKFFLKIGHKVGVVEKTQWDPSYLEAVKNLEQYKLVLSDLCAAIMLICQPNPQHIQRPLSQQLFSANEGTEPLELLNQYLAEMTSFVDNKEALVAIQQALKMLAYVRRNLQYRVRRCMHHMRTFLNVDCHTIDAERKTLMSLREEMDFARHEYEGKANEAKKLVAERAQQRFEAQMNKVWELLNQVPQKKAKHADDLLAIMAEIKLFNDDCMAECEKLSKYRALYGEPTKFDLL